MTDQELSRNPRERELDVEEIGVRLTTSLAVVLSLAPVILWWKNLPDLRHEWPRITVYFALTVLGVVIFLLRERPRVARWVLLGGALAALAGALVAMPSTSTAFFAVLIVMALAAYHPALGAIAAVTSSAIVVVAAGGAATAAQTLIWLALIIAWASSRGLATVLEWSWHSQETSLMLLSRLRQDRQKLNSTLQSLTEATRRLERMNAELVIARRQADEARVLKAQFVANVSHELRTPLNLIVGFADMMYLMPESYQGVVWTHDLQEDLGRLHRASTHLQALVNDILDLSRIDASRLPMYRELTDIGSIVDEAVRTIDPLLQQHHLAYRQSVPSDLPQLFVDRTRIRQVLLNLLNNAIRFTDEGEIALSVSLSQQAVVVSIRDTGVGIPEDQLESVFEEFRQVEAGPAKRGGSGLGLAISQQFVALHGGKMWVESRPSRGSTFHFSLPLPEALPQTLPLQRVPDRRDQRPGNAPLVFVEPDEGIAQMLGRYIEGYPIIPVPSTQEAEDLIDVERPLAIVVNCPPDQLESEWVGPLGPQTEMNQVPVLRCSIPSPSWLSRSMGIADCLSKPITRNDLLRAVEHHWSGKGPILVVDDDPGFVGLVMRMLDSAGYAGAVAAYSGREALDFASGHHVGLVLLDLLMPEMDGFATARYLRDLGQTGEMAIVAVTATSYAEQLLQRSGSHFTLSHSGGITTGQVVELLAAVLQRLRPDYTRGTT